MSFFERLRALAKDRDTLLCVGLDPDPERIAGGAAGALRHCREVVRQTEEHVCCFKPNSAFWEQYGADGWHALLELREEAPNTPFLFDGKRGDMDNTMRAYAVAVFKTLAMDAATVNPYLGADSIQEFARYEDRGVYVVCRSSNPGARTCSTWTPRVRRSTCARLNSPSASTRTRPSAWWSAPPLPNRSRMFAVRRNYLSSSRGSARSVATSRARCARPGMGIPPRASSRPAAACCSLGSRRARRRS